MKRCLLLWLLSLSQPPPVPLGQLRGRQLAAAVHVSSLYPVHHLLCVCVVISLNKSRHSSDEARLTGGAADASRSGF